MADHDRDRAIERLLPQVLGGAASTPCVDGETLAAWSGGALRESEAARVEAHVADCARCQAMVGAFVRITPAPVVAESLWQRWRLGWLLPLATAAAAVALWAVLPMTSVRQESQVTLADASRDTPAAAAPPSAPSPSLPAAQPEADAPAAADPSVAAGRGQVMNRAPATARAPAAGRGQVLTDGRRATDALAKQARRDLSDVAGFEKPAEALTSQRARNEAPAQPAPLIAPESAVAERVAVAPPPPATVPPVPPRPTPPAAAARPAPSTASADTELARQGRVVELRRSAAAKPIEIPTPVASTRWRAGVRSTVERTTNNGATWEEVAGVDVSTLRAGSAPAVDVCWIVGDAGRVYLSIDGRRLSRVNFPESVDLVAVTATDARTATVRAADGRTFSTSDGGASWTR